MLPDYTSRDNPSLLIASLPFDPLHSYEYLEFKSKIDRYQSVLKLNSYTKSYKSLFSKLTHFIKLELSYLHSPSPTPSTPEKLKFLKLKL